MSFEQLKKNTVSSKGQLEPTKFVTFEPGNGLKAMFVGNSITLHGPNAGLGWQGNWGMAASSKENDYVHVCIEKIKQEHPDVSVCICQVAEWERNYKTGSEKLYLFERAREFDADVIISRFTENCPPDDFDNDAFYNEYSKLMSYLDKSGNAKKIITTSFWYHPANDIMKKYADEKGCAFVNLSDLGEKDEMKALGLFEHAGVSHHPGDLGMKTIAERIMEKF